MAASLPRALSSSRPAPEPRGLRRGRCLRPVALLRRRSGGDRPRSAAAPPPAGGPGGPGAGGQRCGAAAATPASVPAPLPGGGHPPGLGVSPRSTPRGPSGDKAGGRVPLNRSSLRWPPAYSGGGGSPVGCKPRVSKPRTSVCLCPTTALLVRFLVSPK